MLKGEGTIVSDSEIGRQGHGGDHQPDAYPASHDVDFGVLASISNGLLFFGGVWLFIIGYGIFHGEQELVAEGED